MNSKLNPSQNLFDSMVDLIYQDKDKDNVSIQLLTLEEFEQDNTQKILRVKNNPKDYIVLKKIFEFNKQKLPISVLLYLWNTFPTSPPEVFLNLDETNLNNSSIKKGCLYLDHKSFSFNLDILKNWNINSNIKMIYEELTAKFNSYYPFEKSYGNSIDNYNSKCYESQLALKNYIYITKPILDELSDLYDSKKDILFISKEILKNEIVDNIMNKYRESLLLNNQLQSEINKIDVAYKNIENAYHKGLNTTTGILQDIKNAEEILGQGNSLDNEQLQIDELKDAFKYLDISIRNEKRDRISLIAKENTYEEILNKIENLGINKDFSKERFDSYSKLVRDYSKLLFKITYLLPKKS